jgi:hypothetical protein
MASAPESLQRARGWLWALPQYLNRRRAKAREAAALAAREVVLDRLAWQIAELRANPRQRWLWRTPRWRRR